MNKLITRISVVLIATVPLTVLAGPFNTLNNPTPKGGTTFQEFIYLLVQIAQLVGIPILVVCIIYSGFLMVTAGGNEEQVSKAKLWIFWTLVGAAIILGAKVLADLIKGTASAF